MAMESTETCQTQQRTSALIQILSTWLVRWTILMQNCIRKKNQSYMLSSNSQTLASTLASTVAFETATSLIHLNLKISEDKQLHQIWNRVVYHQHNDHKLAINYKKNIKISPFIPITPISEDFHQNQNVQENIYQFYIPLYKFTIYIYIAHEKSPWNATRLIQGIHRQSRHGMPGISTWDGSSRAASELCNRHQHVCVYITLW